MTNAKREIFLGRKPLYFDERDIAVVKIGNHFGNDQTIQTPSVPGYTLSSSGGSSAW